MNPRGSWIVHVSPITESQTEGWVEEIEICGEGVAGELVNSEVVGGCPKGGREDRPR